MRQPQIGFDSHLFNQHTPPCISVFQPTHRAYPALAGDPIQFKSLVRKAEDPLRQRYPRHASAILDDLHGLAGDDSFWRQQRDGLGVFCSPDTFRIVQFNRPLRQQVFVADSFHTKPLVRSARLSDRYHLLALTPVTARLYEGDPHTLSAVADDAIPPSIPPEMQSPTPPGARPVADDQTRRYFQAVDHAVWERYSRPSGLPLVLAATLQHQKLFRHLSANQHLLAGGIELNPQNTGEDRLQAEAWGLVRPVHAQKLARAIDQFHAAKAHNRGADDLAAVAEAAVRGRISLLIVDADRQIPGKLDPVTGHIEPVPATQTAAADVLDEVSEAVWRTGGEVCVIESGRMPTASGVAAIYRY